LTPRQLAGEKGECPDRGERILSKKGELLLKRGKNGFDQKRKEKKKKITKKVPWEKGARDL